MLAASDPDGYCAACAAIRDMDQRSSIAIIPLPILVIGGKHDPATPPDDAKFLAKTIDRSQLKILDAAHLSNVEAPSEFNASIIEFLKQIDSSII